MESYLCFPGRMSAQDYPILFLSSRQLSNGQRNWAWAKKEAKMTRLEFPSDQYMGIGRE